MGAPSDYVKSIGCGAVDVRVESTGRSNVALAGERVDEWRVDGERAESGECHGGMEAMEAWRYHAWSDRSNRSRNSYRSL